MLQKICEINTINRN